MEFDTFEDFYSEFEDPDDLNFLIDVSKFDSEWILSIAQPRKDRILTVTISKATHMQVADWAFKSALILQVKLFIKVE